MRRFETAGARLPWFESPPPPQKSLGIANVTAQEGPVATCPRMVAGGTYSWYFADTKEVTRPGSAEARRRSCRRTAAMTKVSHVRRATRRFRLRHTAWRTALSEGDRSPHRRRCAARVRRPPQRVRPQARRAKDAARVRRPHHARRFPRTGSSEGRVCARRRARARAARPTYTRRDRRGTAARLCRSRRRMTSAIIAAGSHRARRARQDFAAPRARGCGSRVWSRATSIARRPGRYRGAQPERTRYSSRTSAAAARRIAALSGPMVSGRSRPGCAGRNHGAPGGLDKRPAR